MGPELYILLPNEEFEKLNIVEKTFPWDGKLHSLEPRVFTYKSELSLSMSIPDYFIKEVHDETKYKDSVLIYIDPSRVYQFERDEL